MKARYVVRSAVVHGKYIRHSSFRLIKLETIILLFKQISLKSKPKCRSQKQARKKYRERRNTASDQQGKKEQTTSLASVVRKSGSTGLTI